MGKLVKLIMAVVNLACLVVTLLYPNSATPFSLLPIIVSTVSWVFVQNPNNKPTNTHFLLLFFAAIISMSCFVMGLTTEINPDITNKSMYNVVFNKDVAIFGGKSFLYETFAISIFVIIAILIICEFVGTTRIIKNSKAITNAQSFDGIVDNALNT